MDGAASRRDAVGSRPWPAALAAMVTVAALSSCTADDTTSSEPTPPTPTASVTPSESAPNTPSPTASDPGRAGGVRPVSVPGLAAARHQGDQLRIGAVRERTASYTSYDVTYRSRSGGRALRISGVLNVPRGQGPFPAVVLAHGYIDPAVYVRGQGMTRERGWLAERGYLALHVDYRNHAESDDDPRDLAAVRLGYSADVINAVKALRASTEVPVDDERVALVGRSMGGGVVLKALIAEPGLVDAAVAWASVSSLEAENYRRFIAPDPEDAGVREELARRYGTPEDNPRFWRENSSRPYLGQITEPVLVVHGRSDDTCPPAWAEATSRALQRAGVDSELQWYDDEHAFGPSFDPAMRDIAAFLDEHLD